MSNDDSEVMLFLIGMAILAGVGIMAYVVMR